MTTVWVDDDKGDRLSGWKEIAQYLGCSVRSVQRWEREAHLPIRRVKTAAGQVVYASRAELNAWRDHAAGQVPETTPSMSWRGATPNSPTDASPGKSAMGVRDVPTARFRKWLIAALILAMAAVGSGLGRLLASRAHGSPVGVAVHGRVAEAQDAQGRVVWTHTFQENVAGIERILREPIGAMEVDVNDDGIGELIVPVRFPVRPASQPVPRLLRSDALLAFTPAGRVLWSVTPSASERVVCGGEAVDGPWQMTALAVSRRPGPKTLWAAFSHLSRSPSFVLEITPDGHQAIRYLQAGPILDLTDWTTEAGPMLGVVGALAEHGRASLVAVDPRQALTMMASPNKEHACEAVGAVPPVRVTLFPDGEIAVASDYPMPQANKVMRLDAGLRVDLAGGAIAMVTEDGLVSEILLPDEFRTRHEQLSREGRVDHKATDCPMLRAAPEVRTWTPSASWQAYYAGSAPAALR